jgi:hypothetical protein
MSFPYLQNESKALGRSRKRGKHPFHLRKFGAHHKKNGGARNVKNNPVGISAAWAGLASGEKASPPVYYGIEKLVTPNRMRD